MRSVLKQINIMLMICLIFSGLISPLQAKSMKMPLPLKYNESHLKMDYEKFYEGLDKLQIAKDFPKVIENLLSDEIEKQTIGLKILGDSQDINAIPWIVQFLDRPIKIYAGLALSKLVYSISIKRQDRNYPGTVILQPLEPNDIDLKPLAWIILKMLRMPDVGNTHAYAAEMIGYINLQSFDRELESLLHSEHPAVVNSAKNALQMLKRHESNEKRN